MKKLFDYYFESENSHFKYAKGEPAIKQQEFHILFNHFTTYHTGPYDLISYYRKR